jgi:hypothetical protein
MMDALLCFGAATATACALVGSVGWASSGDWKRVLGWVLAALVSIALLGAFIISHWSFE